MIQLTLAITTYKRPGLLARCLLSVVKQSDIPHQIIVVDNDPNLSAKRIVKSFRRKLSLKYVSVHRQGTAHARNAAIGACKTALLGFVDDDCELDSSWTKNGIVALTNSNAAYVIGQSLLVNPKSPVGLAQFAHYAYWFSVKYKESFPHAPPQKFDTKNIIIRTQVLKKYKFTFDPDFSIHSVDSSDTDMGLQFEKKRVYGVYCPSMIVKHKEIEDISHLLKKTYIRGILAHKLSSKWNLSGELVSLPYANWLMYIQSIRHWPGEYQRMMKPHTQSTRQKILAFLIMKMQERSYLKGYIYDMSATS